MLNADAEWVIADTNRKPLKEGHGLNWTFPFNRQETTGDRAHLHGDKKASIGVIHNAVADAEASHKHNVAPSVPPCNWCNSVLFDGHENVLSEFVAKERTSCPNDPSRVGRPRSPLPSNGIERSNLCSRHVPARPILHLHSSHSPLAAARQTTGNAPMP